MPSPATGRGLAGVPLFAELPREALAALDACLRRCRVARGGVIFLRGDAGSSLYLLEAGRVRIALASPAGKEAVLALLGPGDFFGELALLDGEPRSADAYAADDCELRLLAREDFLRVLGERPSVGEVLLAVLARRLRENVRFAGDATFLDVPGRLARVLLQLSKQQDVSAGDGAVALARRVSQRELARLAGTTRESVNRWLGTFERTGLVARRDGRLVLLRPEALRARTEV